VSREKAVISGPIFLDAKKAGSKAVAPATAKLTPLVNVEFLLLRYGAKSGKPRHCAVQIKRSIERNNVSQTFMNM
jgi:hypothetical protein